MVAVAALGLAMLGLLQSCEGGGASNAHGNTQLPITINRGGQALPDILPGKIKPVNAPPGSHIVAATAGSAAVDDAGGASYDIPIWVPDGVRGMQPALSISYRSSGGIGALGPKWGISGLSVIKRCRPTLAQDGAKRPIDLVVGDAFCLDADRLVRLTGTPDHEGEFRTEANPYSKILAVAKPENTSGFYFKVLHPDGRIFYYGRSDASCLWGNPVTFPPTEGHPSSRGVYAFYLDKIEDRFGNSILVQYQNQAPLLGGQPSNGAGSQVDELVPSLIQWGGVGDAPGLRSIQFNYTPPPGGHDFAHEYFVGGLGIYPGQGLTSINISGPNGVPDSAPDGPGGIIELLKNYTFTYGAPTITGETLLSTISECDGAQVCKQPTTITWEKGSFDAYDSGAALPIDLTLSGFTGAIPNNVTPTPVNPDLYRRILVADLNRDGRDDIIYRAVVPQDGTPYVQEHESDNLIPLNTCLGWRARLATNSGDFGDPIALGVDGDSDPVCKGAFVEPYTYLAYPAYAGDVVFADINRDGFPDIISPVGAMYQWGNWTGAPVQTSYGVYENSALLDRVSLGFGARINFEVPTELVSQTPDGSNPLVSVADLDGDGFPEIIRPQGSNGRIGGGALWRWTESTGTPEGNHDVDRRAATIAGIGQVVSGFSAIDLDGDGVAELIRDLDTSGMPLNTPPTSVITSPTMNGTMLVPQTNVPAMTSRTTTVPSVRWVLDLNGDGLMDLATVYATDDSAIFTNFNTGRGFAPAVRTSLADMGAGNSVGHAWLNGLDSGVRVVDYNRDGRDDLVLVDDGAGTQLSPGPARTHAVVLLSDGRGGFMAQNTPVPVGDSADGWRWLSGTPGSQSSHGYHTSVILDSNGDGLPDFLQLEQGTLKLYRRLGKTPDVVTGIAEGTGRTITVAYAPAIDSTVYSPDTLTCNGSGPLSCLLNGPLLVSALTDQGGSVQRTQTFAYEGGLYDRNGRGFLGFERRDIFGPDSTHTMKYFRNGTTLALGTSGTYAYPEAFHANTTRTVVDTPQDRTNGHRLINQQITYAPPTVTAGSYTLVPGTVQSDVYDCAALRNYGAQVPIVDCVDGKRTLSSSTDVLVFDAFGNQTSDVTTHYDTTGAVLETDTSIANYHANTDSWLVRLLDSTQLTSSTTTPSETVARTTNYVPNATTGGIDSLQIEANGDDSVHRSRVFDRDTRGRLWRVTESAVDPGLVGGCSETCDEACDSQCFDLCGDGQNSGSCMASCTAACPSWCVPDCAKASRQTVYEYEDGDGVYVTTTTDAVGNKTRVWRHTGLGLVVERDDANGAPTTYSYDSFGRPLSETAASGASTSASYDDSAVVAGGGAKFTVYPEGEAARAIVIKVDPFGNQTSRAWAVDANRTLSVNSSYDALGRISQRQTVSSAGGVLNTEQLTYDDLNRVLTDRHLVPSDTDSSPHVASNTYDGDTTESKDENGKVITRFVDGMGRLSRQEAVISTGISDATFTYGPFSQLEHERADDASGGTDIVYDTLGRTTLITRNVAGSRGMTYDGFGDVISEYKVNSSGTVAETKTMTYDPLGRLTTLMSPGSGTGSPPLLRQFRWDIDPNFPDPSAPTKGKLVTVEDNSFRTRIDFTYDSSGLLLAKTWAVSNGAIGASGAYTAFFSYDPHGRVDTMTYPLMPTEESPLVIKYGYDDYSGEPSTLSDADNPTTPIWSATARDDRGKITGESLSLGGPTVTRASSYFPQDGRLRDASLNGAGGQSATLHYTYQPNGVPLTFGMSGAGGSWKSTFDHDNLGRLISWIPDDGAPTVSYDYDDDGNLVTRWWAGGGGKSETVTYGTWGTANGAERAVITDRDGVSSQLDEYMMDAFGRVLETPALSIKTTDENRIGQVTEKSNGQVDTIYYDGFGNRVLTVYGKTRKLAAGTLLTLGDLFEMSRDAAATPEGTEGRFHLHAGGRLVGDVVRIGNSPRTATFYLEDNVHSVVAEASSDGVVTARARRDPFGNALTSAATPYLPADPAASDPDPSSTNRVGFGGHERDKNWGIVDMMARAYSPRLGRFMSPDPVIGDPFDRRDHNPFAYVRNSPTDTDDPRGLEGGPSGGGYGPGDGYGEAQAQGAMLSMASTLISIGSFGAASPVDKNGSGVGTDGGNSPPAGTPPSGPQPHQSDGTPTKYSDNYGDYMDRDRKDPPPPPPPPPPPSPDFRQMAAPPSPPPAAPPAPPPTAGGEPYGGGAPPGRGGPPPGGWAGGEGAGAGAAARPTGFMGRIANWLRVLRLDHQLRIGGSEESLEAGRTISQAEQIEKAVEGASKELGAAEKASGAGRLKGGFGGPIMVIIETISIIDMINDAAHGRGLNDKDPIQGQKYFAPIPFLPMPNPLYDPNFGKVY